MLNVLRKKASGWLAKLLIGLLVLSFVVWGVSDFLGGSRSHTVATVGDTNVSVDQFERALSIATTRFSAQMRQPLTRAQAIALGLPNQVLTQLLSEAALDDLTKRLNLGISDEKLALSIAENPIFHGLDGRFDRTLFQRISQASQLTEDELIAYHRAFSLRSQMTQAITGDISAPDILLQTLHTFSTEERSVRLIMFNRSDLAEIPTPDTDALQAYFEDNKARYQAPEYRAIDILHLKREDIADASAIPAAAAQEAYEAQLQRFSTPERRHIQQVVFANMQEATAAAEQLAAGGGWQDLLQQRNVTESETDLGLLSKDDIVDQAVAEAVFSLSENQISDVIDGRFGPVIVRVVKIEEAATQPFEKVADQIRQELALDEAADVIYDIRDAIEDALAGGATLADAAQAQNIALRTVDAVDRSGLDPAGTLIQDIPSSVELLQGAFASDEDVENPVIEGEDFFVWYDITNIIPTRERTFEEARTQVQQDWTNENSAAKLEELTEELTKALQTSENFAALAQARGKTIRIVDNMTRANGANRLNVSAVDDIFAKSQGAYGHITTRDGEARFIYEVTGITISDYVANAELTTQIQNAMENEILNQYIASLQDSLGITLNQTLLSQILTTQDQR